MQSFPDSDGVPIPTTSVPSQCPGCPCTSTEIADLKFQIDYKDLTLLGYFPIHSSTNGAVCSHYRSDMGFIEFMAFKYAIAMVNNDSFLLPGLTLGYIAFDTCSNPDHAQEVFKASRDQLRVFSQPRQTPHLTYAQAFIGALDEEVTVGLNRLNNQGHQWVHISPGARQLDSEDYPYFLRSAPAEDTEALALLGAIKSLGWTYLSIVVSDSIEASKMEKLLR